MLSTESSLAFREAVYAEVLSSLYRGARILRSIDAALQQRPLLGQSELEAVKLLRLEASEWMLDRVVDLERSLLEQDMSRLVAGRRTEGQEFFRRGSIPMTDWGRQSAESRQQIRDWDASMMARLQEIIGEVRFTRLRLAWLHPVRDRVITLTGGRIQSPGCHRNASHMLVARLRRPPRRLPRVLRLCTRQP